MFSAGIVGYICFVFITLGSFLTLLYNYLLSLVEKFGQLLWLVGYVDYLVHPLGLITIRLYEWTTTSRSIVED